MQWLQFSQNKILCPWVCTYVVVLLEDALNYDEAANHSERRMESGHVKVR